MSEKSLAHVLYNTIFDKKSSEQVREGSICSTETGDFVFGASQPKIFHVTTPSFPQEMCSKIRPTSRPIKLSTWLDPYPPRRGATEKYFHIILSHTLWPSSTQGAVTMYLDNAVKQWIRLSGPYVVIHNRCRPYSLLTCLTIFHQAKINRLSTFLFKKNISVQSYIT